MCRERFPRRYDSCVCVDDLCLHQRAALNAASPPRLTCVRYSFVGSIAVQPVILVRFVFEVVFFGEFLGNTFVLSS